jgi:MFS transporter, DHA2 family, multidrug resistance protein
MSQTVTNDTRAAAPTETGRAPDQAGLVLLSLILVAAVANLNLSVANVALPDIGKAFDASQTALDLVAVGYSLGLAASVLWLGALGDRYGRKLMLILGILLSVPACITAAFAPSVEVLILARIVGGVSAGMAYPTTLALIAALWSGPGRTRSIALWSALGGAIAALGPLIAGFLLERAAWGSVFLVTLPLAVVALVMAWRFVPAHVNETTEPVDNLGGVLSAIVVGAAILGINFIAEPNQKTLAITLFAIAIVGGILFILRQRRAPSPLYDLDVARRRIFWVAALAGIIVFGSLMGAMFIGQQYLQNVLGYSTLNAGASIIPAALFMVIVAPRSARLVERRGARFTLLFGYVFCTLGFATMFLLWTESSAYWQVGLGYAFMGIGVGLAGTPASHSLTGSVPVSRAGMASGTADLQRDLGGAFMQSIFGALLTAGYAAAVGAAIAGAPDASQITSSTQAALMKSFSSAEAVGQQYPQYASAITAGARAAFLDGADWAYLAGIIAVLVGAAIVFFLFPRRDDERRLLAEYHATDTAAAAARTRSTEPAPNVPAPEPRVAVSALRTRQATLRRHFTLPRSVRWRGSTG